MTDATLATPPADVGPKPPWALLATRYVASQRGLARVASTAKFVVAGLIALAVFLWFNVGHSTSGSHYLPRPWPAAGRMLIYVALLGVVGAAVKIGHGRAPLLWPHLDRPARQWIGCMIRAGEAPAGEWTSLVHGVARYWAKRTFLATCLTLWSVDFVGLALKAPWLAGLLIDLAVAAATLTTAVYCWRTRGAGRRWLAAHPDDTDET